MTLCSPYRPRGLPRSKPQAIVLLRHSDGTPYGERPREMPGYTGDGPAKTLRIALRRSGMLFSQYNRERRRRLAEMMIEADARESEAAE